MTRSSSTSVGDEGQPILFGLEDEMVDRIEDLRYAVVAHLGSAERGLCAIYLCVPIKTERGKIVRWGYAEELYVASRATRTTSAAPAAPPPEEFIAVVPAPAEEPEGDVIVSPKDGD